VRIQTVVCKPQTDRASPPCAAHVQCARVSASIAFQGQIIPDVPPVQKHGSPIHRELSRLKDAFVLRRTAELNAKFLPPASTYIVFCKPSQLQVCPQR